MKQLTLALALVGASMTVCAASSQNYLLGTDVVPARAAPSITADGDRVIAIFETVPGVWVKHTLTPTDETRFGAFGEKVVKMTDVIPNP